jgi:hypothetical protein
MARGKVHLFSILQGANIALKYGIEPNLKALAR